jgi:hypothetical protein
MKFSFKAGRGVVRFVHMFNYPEGISKEEGDRWYMEEHVPKVKALPGVVRYNSWEALPPIKMWTFDPYDRFTRLTELVFEDMESCLNGTIRNPELWASGTEGHPGFRELECVLLDEEPQYDLLKDIPVQQYKYINYPGRYTHGKMMDDDADDVIMDVYMFNYAPKFTTEEGEDWYLGHHTREGRITKRMGHKHYQTWLALKTPEEKGSVLNPNRFYRLSELGLPPYALGKMDLKPGQKPALMTYTQDPRGQVVGEWRNILIDPDKVQDLLK